LVMAPALGAGIISVQI